MSEFRLAVTTDNAAFEDDGMGGTYELARILRSVVVSLDQGFESRELYDLNGNRVGSFEWDRSE